MKENLQQVYCCPACGRRYDNGEPTLSPVRSDALLDSLNQLWRDDCMMRCSLPCEDPACREDMDEDGGCMGADFADKLIQAMESNIALTNTDAGQCAAGEASAGNQETP